MQRLALRLLPVLVLLAVPACGREERAADPALPQGVHVDARGALTVRLGGAPVTLPAPPRGLAGRDGVSVPLRRALLPWVRERGWGSGLDTGARAVLPVHVHPEAPWWSVEFVLAVAGYPSLRVWRADLHVVGRDEPTRIVLPRDPGLYDAGPLVGEAMLPVEHRTVALSVRREATATRRKTTLLLDERAWMERPENPVGFELPRDDPVGSADHTSTCVFAAQRAAERCAKLQPDAVAFFIDASAREDVRAGEVLAVYRALRAATTLPILWDDPSADAE